MTTWLSLRKTIGRRLSDALDAVTVGVDAVFMFITGQTVRRRKR